MKTRRDMSQGRMEEHASGLGTVTEEMVRKRAHELAQTNSRPGGKPNTSDWNQAKKELMGGHATPAEEGDQELPVAKRWDPVPGTPGHRTATQGADDEQTYA